MSVLDFDIKFGPTIQEVGAQIKKRCPSCTHNALWCNVETGLFYCFHCQYKGSLNSGSSYKKISRKKDYYFHQELCKFVIENTSLNDNHKSYLKRRGIPYPEKYKIRSTDYRLKDKILTTFDKVKLVEEGYVKDDNLCSALRYGNVLIPYFKYGEVLTIKARADYTTETENKRYLNLPNSPIARYFWCAPKIQGDLIITEGEFKAIVSSDCFIPSIGLGGMNVPPEVISNIKKVCSYYQVKRIFISFDADVNYLNKTELLSNVIKLSNHFPNSAIVFPYSTGKQKVDLDTFILSNKLSDINNYYEYCWEKREQLFNYYRKKI